MLDCLSIILFFYFLITYKVFLITLRFNAQAHMWERNLNTVRRKHQLYKKQKQSRYLFCVFFIAKVS